MADKLFEEIIEALRQWGLPGVLLFILVLVIQNPERAEKLKLWIVTPFFRLFNWFSKSYVAHSISVNVSEFLNRDLLAFCDNSYSKKANIKVRFVSNKDDILLKKGGLIIRLKEEDDQTRNILMAANLAIPNLVCPLVRSNIDKKFGKAIDLTILKKLADKLGNHARLVYKRDFLDPELLENPTVNDLIEELIKIDNKGFFVSIFINELNYWGEGAFASSDRSNRTDEVINFLRFLINIAERDIGEINDLLYRTQAFGIGVILLAKTERASSQGLTPYLQRLRKNFHDGCESVYIVAYLKAWDFLKKYIASIDKDKRYNVVNTYKLTDNYAGNYSQTKVVLIRPNKIFFDQTLERHIAEIGIGIGAIIHGTVVDVSVENAVVSFSGLQGFIRRSECGWQTKPSCHDTFTVGAKLNFIIRNIDYSVGNIELSLKFPEDDPWKKSQIPSVNDVIKITPQFQTECYLNCLAEGNIETKLPISEIVWGEAIAKDITEIIGKEVLAKVIFIQPETRLIRVSVKELKENPWEEIYNRFPKGKIIMGNVVSILPQYVNVEIGGGIIGRVTKESFYLAGHEYRDFTNNLLIGQKLEVVVQKVWREKEKISLDLKRNMTRR